MNLTVSPKMFSLIIRVTLGLLVLNHLISPCMAFRNSGARVYGSGKYDSKGYKDPGRPKTLAGTSSGVPGVNSTRRGLGISAWGIVFLIVSLVLGGMGFYYFSMCYPILCKKERNYDMIKLETV